MGKLPKIMQPLLFGGRLIALAKKGGGVRPIAVGSTFRRIASKVANLHLTEKLGSTLCLI